jgi:hypothetical protein
VLEDVPFRYARPGDTGTNPVIVKEAVHALYDPDLEVALNAATTLGRFGSRDAEAPLWERLQKWHDQWQSRSEDLVDSHGNVTTDERLGYALSEALRTAQAWVLNAAEVRELQGLCMGRQMLLDATRYNSGVVMIQPLEIGRGLLDSSRWDVGQYRLSSITSLEEKLAQYPPGTVFTVSQFFMSNHPDLTAKLKAFIEARDMKLELTASSRSPSTGQR